MIAAWISLTTGWTLAHPVTLIVFGVLAGLLAIATALYLLATSESGRHHASRPDPPRRAGKARVWLRAAPRAVRSLPGAITWTWSTPVRTKTLGPGAGRPAGHNPVTPSPAPELHHDEAARDAVTLRVFEAMRGLRHPGWTMLTLRRQLTLARALLSASGRVTPGLHTAGSPGSEPGHPAGTQTHDDGQVVLRQNTTGPAPSGECDGGAGSSPALAVIVAAPEMLTLREGRETPLAVRMNATLPPHDPALWQPRRLPDPEQTDWTLLADLAPSLAAERADAQTQAQAGA